MNIVFKTFWITVLLLFSLSFAQKPYVELILDLSGSMWLELESNEFKIDAAKSALNDLITNLPDDSLNMGLRVYGATVSGIDPNACTDSQLIHPIATLDKELLISSIDAREPKGGTPIVYALNEAIQDFQQVPSNAQKTIVLVTDGQESCGGNLEAAIQSLQAQGITLQVIGFGLSERASKAFSGIRGIGAFINTLTSTELTTALEETVMDLNPVESTAPVIATQPPLPPLVEATVTVETSEITNNSTPVETTEAYDVQVDITVGTANAINILNIEGPNQLRYNTAPTTYYLYWDGNASYPLTVSLKDINCSFNNQDAGCIFQSNPITTPLNPIPLSISCSSRTNARNNQGSWTNEIKIVDGNGLESATFILDISCIE